MPNKRKYTCKNENMRYNIDNFVNEERSVSMLSAVKEMFPEYEKLPSPLTKEETEIYISLYLRGNEEAGNIIILHNLRMVLNLASAWAQKGNYDIYDLVREGQFALWNCIFNFESSRSRFSTYAYNSINLALQNYCNRVKREQAHYRDHIITTDSDEKDLFEILPSQMENIEKDYEERETLETIYQMVEQLADDNKKLLKLWLGVGGKNYTFEELEIIFGVSHTTLNRRLNSIIQSMRNQLQQLGILESVPNNLKINGKAMVKK